MNTRFRIALAGNPNAGKTSLFNQLTGAHQHVGNYPGVTVEKREGRCLHQQRELIITDLPGTYSLTAFSIEEQVARDFIVHEKPDLVVDVVDASNLERNLYLMVQLRELGVPLVLALNMSDVAKARGIEFDLDTLSKLLGVPIVPTVASKNIGTDALLDAIIAACETPSISKPGIHYGREIDEALPVIRDIILQAGVAIENLSPGWIALKLLENDAQIRAQIASPLALQAVDEIVQQLEKRLGDSLESRIAEARYGYISGACQECVRSTVEARHNLSDRIDAVLTHRMLALPIFLGLMYLIFQLTFTLGGPPMDWISYGFDYMSNHISGWWPEGSASSLRSLLVDGVMGGVGGVVVFLPNILLLFMAIAILEDTGYMARAAFIMDRLMHKIGLHGKSFIPMLIGFGCSVPAIMATRTLENQRDRITTIMVTPLMSCGARLPIYALIIPAFFPPALHAPMLWLIYTLGIVLAVIVAKLLRTVVLKGEAPPFVMELPPYRMPTIRGIMLHMWERGGLYLKKAGTVILGISVLLWLMTSYPKKTEFSRDYATAIAQCQARGDEENALALADAQQAEMLAYSMAGRIGHALEPVLKPLGFDWRIGAAMIGAFAAKEVFVAQLGIVYSVGEADKESGALRERLRADYSPLAAFCIMLFCLISAPCMATIAVTRRETNSWKWAMAQLGGLTLLAYIITLAVYQTGLLLGVGTA